MSIDDNDKDRNVTNNFATTHEDGAETRNVTYNRPDGKGADNVISTKDPSGVETGHTTFHPDGSVNMHGDHKEAWES